jgi:hypothetical protein
MKDFFGNAGWIILGVVLLVFAVILGYHGLVDLIKGSWGGAIGYFAGTAILLAFTVSAFRQANK